MIPLGITSLSWSSGQPKAGCSSESARSKSARVTWGGSGGNVSPGNRGQLEWRRCKQGVGVSPGVGKEWGWVQELSAGCRREIHEGGGRAGDGMGAWPTTWLTAPAPRSRRPRSSSSLPPGARARPLATDLVSAVFIGKGDLNLTGGGKKGGGKGFRPAHSEGRSPLEEEGGCGRGKTVVWGSACLEKSAREEKAKNIGCMVGLEEWMRARGGACCRKVCQCRMTGCKGLSCSRLDFEASRAKQRRVDHVETVGHANHEDVIEGVDLTGGGGRGGAGGGLRERGARNAPARGQ
eukprot:scaffold15774_cov94-Isochrysis_galbana.AAC.3